MGSGLVDSPDRSFYFNGRLSRIANSDAMDNPMGNTHNETNDFWQEHSLTFLEMAFRTDRQKRPAQPSGVGHNVGTCRDSITMFVEIRGDVLRAVTYEMDGCLHTNACANAVAEIAENQDLDTAWKITPEMVAHYLQTLPEDHFHCAELAVGAFYKALTDYRQNGRKDWQASYRRKA
jgi:nitrogen fixation NifU-like protein